MDDDLIGIGADSYTQYPDGSWEQLFSTGDGEYYSITGDAGGNVVTTTVDDAGNIVDTASQVIAPGAAPDYAFNPGELVKIGAQLYKYVATQQNGRTVYRGIPVTAAQAAALRAQQAQQKNNLLLPALALGAFFLFR